MHGAGLLLAVGVLAAGCGATNTSEAAVSPSPTTSGLVTVAPADAVTMTIAEVLRADGRFTRFREIAERAGTDIAESWLEVWDGDADQMGDDREGVTVFVPTNAAFTSLEPAVLATVAGDDVDNELLDALLGHHYVHRLYPSSAFEAGPQRTWRRSPSGPVELGLEPPTWGGHLIEQTDLWTTNGIIHVLAGVVVPDALAAAASDG